MSEEETARDIDADAAVWAARAEMRGTEPGFDSALNIWLAGDRRRSGALLRAQAALSLAAEKAPAEIRTEPFRPNRVSRRMLLGGSVAAGLAAGFGGAVVVLNEGPRYQTELGEVRRVPLEDGSLAAINTASRLDIELKPALRQVDLLSGEAWFKVAKDAGRPFVVATGPVRVRAVGTAFSVRRRDMGADILVTEGIVEAWSIGAEEKKLRIVAGDKAFVPDRQAPKLISTNLEEIDRVLAWRDGQIALYGETLAYAVAEFNRYNQRKLMIADSSLATEKLVGQFRTDEPDAFAKAVAATLGATIAQDGTTIRLSRMTNR